MGIGFISSSSFKLNNFKTEKFKLTFKSWNSPVCLLFGFTRVSFCQNLLHFTLGKWSESWRLWCRVSFSVVFLSFQRTLAREKRSENCLRFGTGGPSLCLYLLLSRNIIFCPALTMAVRAKKNFWLRDLLTPSARECTIEIWSTPLRCLHRVLRARAPIMWALVMCAS